MGAQSSRDGTPELPISVLFYAMTVRIIAMTNGLGGSDATSISVAGLSKAGALG
jgi:hypothetical protein